MWIRGICVFLSIIFLSFDGINQNTLLTRNSDVIYESTIHVQFKDVNLEKEIATVLGKSESEFITVADMEMLTTLDLSDKGITDLSGLEMAKNLVELNLQYNNIRDIELLANLSKLEVLNLNSTQIKNLSPLENLTQLQDLNLRGNMIRNLDDLSQLKNLKTLNLNYTAINNIDGLANLINLEILSALSCRIDNVESLSNLTNLKYLRLEENEIKDITPLKNLKKLEYINIMYNQIADLSPLQGIAAYVSAYGNQITLEPHQIINGVLLIQNPLKDVDGNVIRAAGYSNPQPIKNGEEIIWENVTDLNEVSFDFYKEWKTPNPDYIDCSFVGEVIIPIGEKVANQAPTISVEDMVIYMGQDYDVWNGITATDAEDGDITYKLRIIENNVNIESPGEYEIIYSVHDSMGESVTKVRKITVVTPYVDIPDLNLKRAINYSLGKGEVFTEIKQSEMETLEFLSIYTDETINLEGIQYATNLKKLILGNITNIEDLKMLTNLTSLTLSSFEYGNIEVLGKLTNLNYLIIHHYKESGVEWLENLKNLQTLYLLDGNITDLSVFSQLTNLETLDLSNQAISNITPLKSLINLRTLNLSHNLVEDISSLENLSTLQHIYLDYNKIRNISNWNKFNTFISVTNQEIDLEEVVIDNENVVLSIPVSAFKNQQIDISNISHGGIVNDNQLEWTGLNEAGILTFDFLSTFEGDLPFQSGVYSGAVKVPIRTNYKPEIFVNDIDIVQGDQFNTLADVYASDKEDGDLTSKIEVIGEVDINTPGEYVLTYKVVDGDGNMVTKTRVVYVVYVKEDLNQDGIINELDLMVIQSYYGIDSTCLGFNKRYDLNEDGIIDLYDIVLISNRIES